MAFRFPTRAADRLFFPTVHVHDGQVHDEERFDHDLFFQGDAIGRACLAQPGIFGSDGPARHFLRLARAGGIVDGGSRCFVHGIHGRGVNRDVWASAD